MGMIQKKYLMIGKKFKIMDSIEELTRKLMALSRQDGDLGKLSVEYVANAIYDRDCELSRYRKIMEEDVSERRKHSREKEI